MPVRSPHTRSLRVLAALAVAGFVAGCGGTTERAPGLPLHSPLVTASPRSSPTVSPVSARQQVHDVIARYFAVLNRLHVEMKDAALASLLTPDCPCQQQVAAIRTAGSKGERYLDKIRLIALRVNLDGPRSADVLADYRLLRGGLIDASGHRISRVAPHRVRWDFALRRTGGQWRIDRIDDLS